jgi:hypothetical protein
MSSIGESYYFEESAERLKLVIPIRVNWLLFALFSFALAVWAIMIGIVLLYLIRGLSSSIVLTVLLILWLGVWLWFGRFLWARWQYHAANREILFIDTEQVIVRRPVSILGLTTSYHFGHVTPFYFSEPHNCPAFDYAFYHVYFGRGLPTAAARRLIEELNARYFPDEEDED